MEMGEKGVGGALRERSCPAWVVPIQQAVTRRGLTLDSLEGRRGGFLGPVKCSFLRGFP